MARFGPASPAMTFGYRLLIGFWLAAALPLNAADKRNITEKDLFKFQWIGDPRLSPDGAQVVFVRVTVDEKGDRYATSLWSVPTVIFPPVIVSRTHELM